MIRSDNDDNNEEEVQEKNEVKRVFSQGEDQLYGKSKLRCYDTYILKLKNGISSENEHLM